MSGSPSGCGASGSAALCVCHACFCCASPCCLSSRAPSGACGSCAFCDGLQNQILSLHGGSACPSEPKTRPQHQGWIAGCDTSARLEAWRTRRRHPWQEVHQQPCRHWVPPPLRPLACLHSSAHHRQGTGCCHQGRDLLRVASSQQQLLCRPEQPLSLIYWALSCSHRWCSDRRAPFSLGVSPPGRRLCCDVPGHGSGRGSCFCVGRC
mmetsp:Transcript_4637/g.12906  ORF Transcript_4637/g.12906 Transcript_4637/m.12906 type:complete len:208 (+) Transcript_4637:336-959(+)